MAKRVPSPDYLRDQWRKYVAGGRRDDTVRNLLIENDLPKARWLAKNIATRICHYHPVEDLFQAGAMAMLKAAKRYDPERTKTFFGFCSMSVRGAMLDLVRELDPVSRNTRLKEKSRRKVEEKIWRERGRVATDDEVQSGLGWDVKKFAESLTPKSVGLGAQASEDSSDTLHEILAQSCDDPSSHLQVEHLARKLLSRLTMDEQSMIWMWAVRGATMKNIAVAYGLSESRVSQLMKSARLRLMRELDEETLYDEVA